MSRESRDVEGAKTAPPPRHADDAFSAATTVQQVSDEVLADLQLRAATTRKEFAARAGARQERREAASEDGICTPVAQPLPGQLLAEEVVPRAPRLPQDLAAPPESLPPLASPIGATGVPRLYDDPSPSGEYVLKLDAPRASAVPAAEAPPPTAPSAYELVDRTQWRAMRMALVAAGLAIVVLTVTVIVLLGS